MSLHIPASIANAARLPARDLCEYCHLPQWSQEATFHLDHIVPLADGGKTTIDNIALACVTCSLKKGSRTRARDPKTRRLVALCHPRREKWADHFRWTRQWRVFGLTPTGRTTIRALGINRLSVVLIRKAWALLGKFPVTAGEDFN